MKPFLELSPRIILSKVRRTIGEYVVRLGLEEDRFSEPTCLEQALETIRDYYCQRHGIRYLERPTDAQICEMDEAVAHYAGTIREMVSQAHLKYAKDVTMNQINRVRVQTLLVPALKEAGYKVCVNMDGNRVSLSVWIATGRYTGQTLSFTLRPSDELTPGRIERLKKNIRELEVAISRFEDVTVF